MAIETIDIAQFSVDAAKSINDLKNNIRELRRAMGDMRVGTKEYAEALLSLQNNQAALKDAMHDTTYETDEAKDAFASTARAAQGLGSSYNALVRQMADLDQQFRREEDVAKRDLLGAQIKNINAQLKELDAQRGKYQRNVGNYETAIKGLSNAFKQTAGSAASVIAPVQRATGALQVLSTTPVVGVLGLLAAALSKVITGLQSSEENTRRWSSALSAFRVVGDAATRTIQAIGQAVSKTAEFIVDLMDKWGWMTDEMRNRQNLEQFAQNTTDIERRLLLENARLTQDVAEAREKASDREMYTAAQRLEFLQKAQWAETQIGKNNELLAQRRLEYLQEEAKLTENSKEVNDKLVQAEVDLINVRAENANKQRTLMRQINAVRKETAKNNIAAVEEEIEAEKKALATWNDLQKAIAEGDKRRDEELRETTEIIKRADQELVDEIDAIWAEHERKRDEDLERERERTEARKTLLSGYADAVSSILGSIADMVEADGEQSKRAAQQVKSLRTASAIIETISGAIAAYMGGVKTIPGPAGIALGVAQAATVLAAGMANVKKIQATKVGDGDTSGASVPALAAAPAAAPAIQQTRTITGASEVDRLNRMASDSRVYLVYSDLEIANTRQRVRVQETDF